MADDELILVGGGLQSGLIALAALHRRPELRLTLVERDVRLAGNHTWCFHAGDVPAAAAGWLQPLVARRWPAYDVVFPGFRRTIDQPYSVVTSEGLAAVVDRRLRAAPGGTLLLGAEAVTVGAREVGLADGRRLRARVVVDARGPRLAHDGGCGFQKFVGLELQLREPAGLERPVVMDATVPQAEGYRFHYALPLAPDRVLLEDTFFGDTPDLERAALRRGLLAAAQGRGWDVVVVRREEEGVLPMPWRRSPPPDDGDGPFLAGYRGGWFHPATGYSFPAAVRVAMLLAEHLPSGPPQPAWSRLRSAHERQAAFGRMLNRLLFTGLKPSERWRVFERFCRLPEATIRRFYAMETRLGDRVRILAGSPPRGFSPRRLLARWGS